MDSIEGFLSVELPNDSHAALKCILDLLLKDIRPTVCNVQNKISLLDGAKDYTYTAKLVDVFALCTSQIKKCVLSLFEVFKTEYQQHTLLQESRQCCLERLLFCFNRLKSIEKHLQDNEDNVLQNTSINDVIEANVMYFVNWIDHTFEVLSRLADVVYKTDYKGSEDLYKKWKNEMVDCVHSLHVTIDELLLSAMTLCKYCLPGDQLIVKARCQVVLRETKSLLSELTQGDLSTAVKFTSDILKLPVMPSNVNVLIDVLKDVLYVLETNTNTALLALVVHCFSYNRSPVDILKAHFRLGAKGTCLCLNKSGSDDPEDCSFVKDFDLYNERLLQIGNFAVSCSSDQNRILSLRSGLASLEALDPHLVPALSLSPDGLHSGILARAWRQEVRDVRDHVFLIVDPAAFSEKCKQMMHQKLTAALKEVNYNTLAACAVVDVGCVLHDFFAAYTRHEPDALTQHDKLLPLLGDLDKVQMECKIVTNMFSSPGDQTYNVTTPTDKPTLDQLTKRLKLLYTIVSRINSLLHPKENDDNLFANDIEDPPMSAHTVNDGTYVNSPRKRPNMSRSIFARTTNIRSSTRNFPLTKLTKHLGKTRADLNFSAQIDLLFDGDEDRVVKHLVVREPSVMYFSPIQRRSLRKAVLNRQCKDRTEDVCQVSGKTSIVDDATSLQITQVLDELDMTSMVFTIKQSSALNTTHTISTGKTAFKEPKKNILKPNINNQNTTISKHIWNIPVNCSTLEVPLDEASNVTQPSNVDTLERLNDLDLVEGRLTSLRSQMETSL